MIFSSKAARHEQRALAGLAGAAALAVLTLLASCGGGTSQFETFVPGRVLAYGDETSALTSDGHRYGVNGLDTSGNFDCSLEPLWVQEVASSYGFNFAECNPGGAVPRALMFAAAGTRAVDLTAQIEQQVATGGFRDNDLALVMVGINDIVELYRQFPGRPRAELVAEAGGRGRTLARAVNRMVSLGARVIVSTIPDVGQTPFARAEEAGNFDNAGRAALMSEMSAAFNEQLGVTVLLDGRFVGLMQADLSFQGANRSPASFTLTNVSEAVCTVAPPACTTATVVSGATPSLYLWADGTRLAPGGQGLLRTLALDRARRNPF
ncbi:Esterase [Rubrivivax sp. A210]|uniref:SGNH/GDSL hydrolase family protein n=1 Tax=Rubrivivax sp. A210 TaxID=2772301 RepID=UPI00191B5775|nr:SGNH/GDSL hydrolase family protein [Rubrivivax sp. A210]CAD5374181.1 Esterase [Rubrivivax sp. A210]